ncbi:MAG: energy transducer TonB [Bacteroidales bacterium]|nr:energy transducer TonB [Bacteroidales bacterium]
MEEKKKKKHFLEKPQYPGGQKALRDFVNAHLQYPEDAMQQRIEGVVTVAYMVSDDGEIVNPTIVKGLCPSCNAEAIRIVNLLKYGKAFNRGVRLKVNNKLNIHFKLSSAPTQSTISYTVQPAKPKGNTPKSKPSSSGYQYSIDIS